MNQCYLQLFTSEFSDSTLSNMRSYIINDLWEFLRCISLARNLSKEMLWSIIENVD